MNVFTSSIYVQLELIEIVNHCNFSRMEIRTKPDHTQKHQFIVNMLTPNLSTFELIA